MFYAHFVLAKKGPLARIWLAAHWDKKLTKAHVFETNIESSVEGILQPKVKMALRTSGHLLLGIVRIYSRKAKYLLADCNEAFIKIKMAFRPGVVDLPEGNREAAVATITLPEVFHDFDTAMPNITIDMDAQASLNQSRAEDITLKEDYGTLSLMTDDGFGDMGFDEAEVARDATNIDEGFDHASLLLCADQSKDRSDEAPQSNNIDNVTGKQSMSLDINLKENLGAVVSDGLLEADTNALFEPAGLFDDAPLGHAPLDTNLPDLETSQPPAKPTDQQDDSDDDMYDMGPGSIGAPSPPSSPGSPPQNMNEEDKAPPETIGAVAASSEDNFNSLLPNGIPSAEPGAPTTAADTTVEKEPVVSQEMPPPPPPPPAPIDQTTLLHNEEESFALAPLDATIVQGTERAVKTKRKRKLIVDEIKNISGEEMKSQLSDTTDIVTTLDLAPPTKRLMHWKETGGVEKLFALPGHPILSKTLSRMYQRHLTTRSVDNGEFGQEEDRIDLDSEMEQHRDEEPIARKRRREDLSLSHDMHNFDQLHLDSSRPSYPHDPHALSHQQSLDMSSNYIPQHHMFPSLPDHVQSPFAPPVMTPPPAHMVHHMLPPDMNVPGLPNMVPLGGDQGAQFSPMPPLPEPYSQPLHFPNVEPEIQHPISEPLSQSENVIQQPSETNEPSQFLEHTSHHGAQDRQVNDLSSDPVTHGEKDILPPYVNGEISGPELPLDGQDHARENGPVPLDGQLPEHESPSEVNDQTLSENEIQNNAAEQIPPSDIPFETLSNDIDAVEAATKSIVQYVNGDAPLNTDMPDSPSAVQKLLESQQSDEEDDYGAPGSVGPIQPEEQMADETYEQFEERILTKRTTHMLHMINNQLDVHKEVIFSNVARNNRRKQVAQKFYTFLVLKKQQAVELQQNEPYGDLIITKGPKFNAVYNAN